MIIYVINYQSNYCNTILSIASNSSFDNGAMSTILAFSAICEGLLAPIRTLVRSESFRIHFNAICESVQPCSCAIALRA